MILIIYFQNIKNYLIINMCGITGIISGKPINNIEKINESISILKNRGPDDSGIWISKEKNSVFGHTRLSIQDTSKKGSQPMISNCGNYIILFNGEIYNKEYLKSNIPKNKKDNLNSTSDTEILLYSLIHNGLKKTCKLINGMFSLVFYDLRKKKIFLARDKFGEKPLFYSLKTNLFCFASTIDALKVYLGKENELDLISIDYFLRYGYIQSSRSIYKEVKPILPAEIIEIDTDTFELKESFSYWNIYDTFQQDTKQSRTEDLFEAISKSVEERLIGDVDIGCFLSGGIDSSMIASIASKKSSKKIKTFSIGFENPKFDESQIAKNISKYINTEHYEYIISNQELFKFIPEISSASDQPFADSSLIPMLALCKLSSEKVKVCLSGDGADEMFGGYQRYRRALFLEKNIKPYNFIASKVLRFLIVFLNKTDYTNIYYDKFQKIKELLKTKNIGDLYDEISSLGIGLNISKNLFTNTIKTNLKNNLENKDFLKLFLISDLKHYLPEDILIKSDRASMHYSLEVRSPFLDKEIMKIALGFKSKNLMDFHRGKKPLREISNKIFPKNMILKNKKGFSVPINYWIREPLKDWSKDLINNSFLVKNNIIERKFLDEIYHENMNGKRNWSHQLWAIFMFEDWFRKKYIS